MASLEASLEIELDKNLFEFFKNFDFAELCIASSAKVKGGLKEGIKATTVKAMGKKCPVCWKISEKGCIRHK